MRIRPRLSNGHFNNDFITRGDSNCPINLEADQENHAVMAAFNRLSARLGCPRCGRQSDMTVDLYFGFRDQLDYKLGDAYRWREGRSVKNGGRPPDGNLDGEGYTECPACAKDFWVIVRVRNDVLESVEPNTEKKPFIPD